MITIGDLEKEALYKAKEQSGQGRGDFPHFWINHPLYISRPHVRLRSTGYSAAGRAAVTPPQCATWLHGAVTVVHVVTVYVRPCGGATSSRGDLQRFDRRVEYGLT